MNLMKYLLILNKSKFIRELEMLVSSLYDGKRIAKNTIIFDVLGELDELSCRIGMLCVLIPITGF